MLIPDFLFSITKDETKIKIRILGISLKINNRKNEKETKHYMKKIMQNEHQYSKDTYILSDCLVDNNAENVDAYTLFCQMRKRKLKAYYVVAKSSNLYSQLLKTNSLENIIGIDNSSALNSEFLKSAYEQLLQAKAVITSFGFDKKMNKFFKQQKSLTYIMINHGITFLKESVLSSNYLFPKKQDKILVCSDIEGNLLKKYGFGEEQLIKASLPRFDRLLSTHSSEHSILLMPTFRKYNKRLIEYSLYKKKLLKIIQELENISLNKNIKIYFAPHHSLIKKVDVSSLVKSDIIEIINSEQISQYIKKCSCLITDISSVAFDFMFQNKPVLFYLLDKGCKYLKGYEQEDFEKMIEKKKYLPNIFENLSDVLKKLDFYINNNFQIEEKTMEQYQKFFYIKENICDKIIEELEKLP